MALLDSQSKTLLVVAVLLLIWTTLFACCRCWAKWSQKKWSWVDGVFGSAYGLGLAQCTTVFLATTQYGLGPQKRSATHSMNLTNDLYAGDLLYIICVGLTRCSTAFFLSGLSRQRTQSLAGIGLATVSAAWTIAGVVAIAARTAPWTVVEPPFARWLGVECAGLAVEIALWAFAFVLVWGLNMPVLRRMKLILIFGLRLIIVPPVVLRLVCLSPSKFHSTDHDITLVGIYTQAAMSFAIIAKCLTCLKPFLQTFYDYAPGNVAHYWGDLLQSHGHSGDRSEDGIKLSKSGMVV